MKKRLAPILIALTVFLCLILTGCFTLVGNIIDGIDAVFQFVQAFGDDVLPEVTVYGSSNPLAVGFRDKKIIAFWDADANYDYIVTVKGSDGKSVTYDPADPLNKDYYGQACFYLDKVGFDYSDNLEVSLKKTAQNGIYEKYETEYSAISKSDYEKYAKNVAGGFTDIDSYIATRYEMFEYLAYLLIFRPNSTDASDGGKAYEQVKQDFYMAYDFEGIYGTLTKDDAFKSEVLSAVASFEDSAAYNYSFELNGNIGTYTINFQYDKNPYLVSPTKDNYLNATTITERPHYNTAISHERKFPIDDRTNSVTVSSSDQLYFAIKKGYKPEPVKGSNAGLIYDEMRRILSLINSDNTSIPTKIHNIYDYIVDTVIYDYAFVNDVITKKVEDESIFFSYNCLYLEGVFGFKNGTFNPKERVAICDGLSKAFLCLTQIEGINSLKISGSASGGAHAWNKVQVSARWYMVDTTWGNVLEKNREYLSHDYLMTRDDASHEEDKWFYYPKATGKYNFIFSE